MASLSVSGNFSASVRPSETPASLHLHASLAHPQKKQEQLDCLTMTMASFGKLAAACCRSAPSTTRSLAATTSHTIGFFSTAAAAPTAASKKQPTTPGNNYTRYLPPTTLVPPTPLPTLLPPTPTHRRVINSIDTETNNHLVIALQNLQKKEKTEINKLQWMLDALRIAHILPPSSTGTSQLVRPVQQQQQQHRTFQVMNRNARKAKRANHGKRPCSRVRRRYKVKAWANTSRKG